MDIVDCEVKLGGDNFNSVIRKEITCAEVAVLREIHGPDAVVNIWRKGDTRKSQREIREHLEMRYPVAVVNSLWGETRQQVDNLPRKLKDIGIDKDSPLMHPKVRDIKKVEEPDIDFGPDTEEEEKEAAE